MSANAMSLTEEAKLTGHKGRVWQVAWTPDGAGIASCSGDRSVRLWEHLDGQWHCKHALEDMHKKTVRSVCWSPGGHSLASASFDGTTAIWRRSAQGWEQVAILEGHENEVKCVAYAPSGSLLATCGRDKTVWLWESFPGDDFECVDVKQNHTQDVKKVAWHPTSGVLVSASYDDTIKLWKEDADGSEWYCAQTLEGVALGHASTVWDIAFNREGTLMASVSDDRAIKVWSCEAKDGEPFYKLIATITGHHERGIFSVAWSAAGAIATACGDNSVRVFEHYEGAWCLCATAQQAHEQDVNCVAWHPTDVHRLASCSDDGCIKMWRYSGSQQTSEQNAEGDPNAVDASGAAQAMDTDT